MKREKIKQILDKNSPMDSVLVKGWVRTKRESKEFTFLEINDGSCLKNIQVVSDHTLENYDDIIKITTGSAVSITGKLVVSPGKGQSLEIQAENVDIVFINPENYPLQKKRHTDEFLRTIAHLRPRTNKYGAVFRIRSELSYAIHQFFKNMGFFYIHTPIITGSDCEGAGELFRVTTLKNISDEKTDFYKDFFGKEASLTVSGQLSAEMYALSLGDVYTFGPTFRAENSNTSRHAAEFWMIEPEMAFCDIEENMGVAEKFIQYIIQYTIDNCKPDLDMFCKFVDKELMTTLDSVISRDFKRLTYKEAIDILIKSGEKFDYGVSFGNDLQSEHERYLTDIYYKGPVIVYNYPKTIKPFYMRLNDDNKTVAAMDILVPRIGELIGGSQREERLDVLKSRMQESGLNLSDYWWYLESRTYGSVPHSGFGLGFERLIMFITGITNIRDVISFPRTPGNIDF
ncbi:MAG: asparagine--tRNA ligase [Proteobacteria bacterium]|nr:asparagine--tRNA ligase [Pseudomonadota bacterium]